MGVNVDNLDEGKLEELQGKVIGDVAGALGLLLSYMGDRLDLYSALAEISPATSDALAASTGLPERYLREWLSANAAGGYIEFDPATQRFSMTPEQAVIFAAEGQHPLGQIFYSFSTLVCVPASTAQEVGLALGAQAGEKRLTEVLREGGFTRIRRATETPTNMVLEARA